MLKVFISYRRQDTTPGWAALIHERLQASLGAEVFMDVDNLPYGEDFEQHIQGVLQDCDVTLVLIGTLWLAPDEAGRSRLNNRRDIHRLEIAEALRQERVRVIPVLIGPAKMPRPEDLPRDVRPLVKRHACFWHLDQAAATQLQVIEDAVRPGPVTRSWKLPSETTRPRRPNRKAEVEQLGGALSAQVLALCAELLQGISDEAIRARVKRLQSALREPVDDDTHVLGDAARADEALVSLEALSWEQPALRFIRDRVEELRDRGPDMRLIELAKWYERARTGEVQLPREKLNELEHLLTASSPAERTGLARGASERELAAAAADRVVAWRRVAASALDTKTLHLASDVVQFYEEMSGPGGKSGGVIVDA